MRQLRTKRGLVPRAREVREIIEEIKRATGSDARVLISGDTMVGKEAIARRIHEQSARRLNPFVAMNCAGLGSDRLSSLFFGQAERADKGTLFIDEIGELDSHLQQVLLNFLETGKLSSDQSLDVRIIAASSRSLHDKVVAGRFNAALFYRLNIMHIVAPERRGRDRDGRRFGQVQRRFRLELGAFSCPE